MRVLVASMLVTVGLVGCDRMDSVDTDLTPPVTTAPATPDMPSATNDATPATPDAAGSAVNSSIPDTSTGDPQLAPGSTASPDNTVAPDNTAVNERDADGDNKTPINQDENQDDVNRTAEIRQKILATEGMSVNARNVKVITSKGKVTLRGPVNSDTEKETIDRIAREVAGDQNVDNQIEVTKPQE